MRLYRKAIADFIWEAVFAIAALRWRKQVPPAKPYSQADAVATSITNLKGAKP
jgi:hypothetical protein